MDEQLCGWVVVFWRIVTGWVNIMLSNVFAGSFFFLFLFK